MIRAQGAADAGTTMPVNQDERSTAAVRLAETRARLLDAVVESLAQGGYAATTSHEVARRSGLTRGAQLHHFGTKDRMMLAAVEHLTATTDVGAIAAALDQLPDDGDRLRTVLEILVEVFSGPGPAAYVELWGASRSDAELADALRATDTVARAAVLSLFGEEILARAGAEFEAVVDLTLYALRGMALDAHLASEDDVRARKALVLGQAKYLEASLTGSDQHRREEQ
jgi:AcrR family transcriptional regulator